eukprot:MONOS_1484.1-p1 / transcript=MONOS_1484.1 / gene=MONOS_1484 / organism=Monocercomonoides_exilis_PA203 / gene_product=unspecified product / transcript_product=unspecified product / location=Mono_scaffold00026:140511-141222(+) / protein_length=171 / sequence_SO=supercontig / SO=protein_coding / is_pseudo=false
MIGAGCQAADTYGALSNGGVCVCVPYVHAPLEHEKPAIEICDPQGDSRWFEMQGFVRIIFLFTGVEELNARGGGALEDEIKHDIEWEKIAGVFKRKVCRRAGKSVVGVVVNLLVYLMERQLVVVYVSHTEGKLYPGFGSSGAPHSTFEHGASNSEVEDRQQTMIVVRGGQ